ncbi:T9SS type A sorting domain-containing protein [Flavobacterium sp. H122]|uniref:T9SS type A sorting domain-containing protein n=1 Tax=Flavobacterium sp. H122 TaxID=2529860 RepID=UPI0010AA9B3D|nr:T9SS type A sorting domain-containing protein [Flavobacterium sp. H122]
MKKIYLFGALLTASISFGQAPVPFYEPFDYNAPSALQGQNSWTSINSGDDLSIISGSLTPTATLSGYPSSLGNKLTFGGAGIDASKQFASQISGTVYYSFLLKVNDLTSTTFAAGSYIAGLVQGASTTYGATLWLKNATPTGGGTTYYIGVNPRTTTANTLFFPDNTTPTALNVGETYLIVVANEIVSSTTNDKVRIWVNPTIGGGTEPSGFSETTNTLTDLTSIDRMLIRQGSASDTPTSLEIDELRIANNWNDATTNVVLKKDNFDNISGLQVYPNPAKQFLNITSASFAEKQVVLYDVLGKIALTAKVTNQPLNVASLPKGVYVAKITEEGKIATRKVVIE